MNNAHAACHEGRIEKASGGVASVRIERASACSHCRANPACGMGEKAELTLDVPYSGLELRPGDDVRVLVDSKAGARAVVLTYGIPSVILIAGMLIASLAFRSELAVGALAVAALLPYYLALFLLRARIGRAMNFRIEKDRGEA